MTLEGEEAVTFEDSTEDLETGNVAAEAEDTVNQDTDTSEEKIEEEIAESGDAETKTTLPEALKDVPEGFIKKYGEVDLTNPANVNLVKSAYEAEKTMYQIQNKMNQLEKSTKDQEFTNQKAQVSSDMQNLNQSYEAALAHFSNEGATVIQNALAALEDEQITAAQYAQIVAEENQKYVQIKAEIDKRHNSNTKQVKEKELTLSKQLIEEGYKGFEEANKDKLALPYNKELIDNYRAKYNNPEDLPNVLEFAENYLKSYLKHQAAQKQIADSVNADKKGMTTTVGKVSKVGSKPQGLADLAKMSDSEYTAYLKEQKLL